MPGLEIATATTPPAAPPQQSARPIAATLNGTPFARVIQELATDIIDTPLSSQTPADDTEETELGDTVGPDGEPGAAATLIPILTLEFPAIPTPVQKSEGEVAFDAISPSGAGVT